MYGADPVFEPAPNQTLQKRNIDDVIGQVQGTLNCISLFTSNDKDSLIQLKEQISAAKEDLEKTIEQSTVGVEVIKARSMLNKVEKVEELVQKAIDGDIKALEEAESIGQVDASMSGASDKKSKQEEVKRVISPRQSVVESPRKASRAKDIAPQSQLRELTFQQSLDTLPKELIRSSMATVGLAVSCLLMK